MTEFREYREVFFQAGCVIPKVEPRLWDSSLRKSLFKKMYKNEIKLKTQTGIKQG